MRALLAAIIGARLFAVLVSLTKDLLISLMWSRQQSHDEISRLIDMQAFGVGFGHAISVGEPHQDIWFL